MFQNKQQTTLTHLNYQNHLH